MIVKIEKRTNPFVMVDKSVIEDNRLSLKARGLLTYLLSRPPQWTIVMSHLLGQFKEGKDSIQAGFAELKECGYAKLETQRNEKGRIEGSSWVIYEKPIWAATDSGVSRQPVKPSDGKSAPNKKEKTSKKDRRTGDLSVCPSASSEKAANSSCEASISNRTFLKENNTVEMPTPSQQEAPVPDEQALTILMHHPGKQNASKAIPAVQKAIVADGYQAVLDATRAYAKHVEESGTQKPSWPSYWYGEKQYKIFLPLPVEEPIQIDDDEPVILNRLRKPVDLPEVSDEDEARMARELEEYQLRVSEEAVRN